MDVLESIPTLIDEDLDLESLFAGGEDLFEFLDERVPATPVIPPAPAIAAAPIAVAAPTPTAESREPYGYTAPVFFPFGKPEPTAPQLKLSGVSSFKKINRICPTGIVKTSVSYLLNPITERGPEQALHRALAPFLSDTFPCFRPQSRLLQGGALSDREEADAIRELERALGVLGHQKRFLREHRAGLEKWTSAVYGFKLSTQPCGPSGTDGAAMGNRQKHDALEPLGGGPSLREVRVNVKCKGTKRKTDKQPLFAHVDQTWSPRHTRFKNVKKRSSVRAGAEKTAKRGKPAFAKVDQAAVVEASTAAKNTEGILEDGLADGQKDGMPGEQGAPGQGWHGPESRTPLPFSSERQQLQEELGLEAEDRLGVASVALAPSGSSAPAGAKAVVDPGAGCDRFEDDADVLRQRLVQALVAPVVMEGAQKCDEQRNTQTERTSRKPSSTDTVHLVDVAQLSLAQRVLVQLNGVGVFGVGYQDHRRTGSQALGAQGWHARTPVDLGRVK